jgi:hypothetical protein
MSTLSSKIKKGQIWISKRDPEHRLQVVNKKGDKWRMAKLDTGHNTHEMKEAIIRKHYSLDDSTLSSVPKDKE